MSGSLAVSFFLDTDSSVVAMWKIFRVSPDSVTVLLVIEWKKHFLHCDDDDCCLYKDVTFFRPTSCVCFPFYSFPVRIRSIVKAFTYPSEQQR